MPEIIRRLHTGRDHIEDRVYLYHQQNGSNKSLQNGQCPSLNYSVHAVSPLSVTRLNVKPTTMQMITITIAIALPYPYFILENACLYI